MDSNKFDDTNRGALFPNDYKEQGDNKPDLTGKLNVEGKSYRIAAWEKTFDSGKEYLSIQLTDPEARDKEVENHQLGAGFAHKDTKKEQQEQQEEQDNSKIKDEDLPF